MSDQPATQGPVEETHQQRLDVEGMRAIAIGTVLAFHAGLPWFAGGFVGVDVFFVLSGFLITGLLARELSRSGRVRLGRFWARRARRLLPASALVLLFSTAVTWFALPLTQRGAFGGDIVSAALYVVNWRLADRSVDYLAEDVGASPVQHFWSLAVEEQFYLVWPVLLLLVALLARKRVLRGAFLVLALVALASFAWAVHLSRTDPAPAFFVSTTRAWELAVGGLLALAAPQVHRVPAVARAALGWMGLLAVGCAALAFDGSTTWPGVATLVPVLGTAAMLASGVVPTRGGPGTLLSLKPLVWLGGLSYSLYLWHWPVLVAGEALIDDFRIRHGVVLTLLSVVPAWLSLRYVENPIRFGVRFKPDVRSLQLGAVLTSVGVALGLVLVLAPGVSGLERATPQQAQGARALLDSSADATDPADQRRLDRVRPLPQDASDDRPAFYDEKPECQVAADDDDVEVCAWGDTDADRTVVIVGDSKIGQWQPVLADIASDEGWRLLQITKSACTFTDSYLSTGGSADRSCRTWGQRALRTIEDLDPDLVLTSGGRNTALADVASTQASQDAMADGLTSIWGRLTDRGIPVAVLLDNPRPSTIPVYECVAENVDDLQSCTFDLDEGRRGSGAPAQQEAAARAGVGVIDLTDVVCPDGRRCPAVIGDVLVYRQGTHLTVTFVRSAREQLERALSAVGNGSFGQR
ncbi:acyltransferase family protein [Aeromicrobium sp. 50.2.37]|uniref:acyltransferase family protein n=1 Tax=Aeromicrobium sp. 50.2.37 TaxID=2969305 RepID=UPI00214FEED9|nr:acyltransferase family protein [Aeromicrobium sp. 50.2.37]MCR4513384.1 acyltransferase [Aeromicrobium sp. 50.2.37]